MIKPTIKTAKPGDQFVPEECSMHWDDKLISKDTWQILRVIPPGENIPNYHNYNSPTVESTSTRGNLWWAVNVTHPKVQNLVICLDPC